MMELRLENGLPIISFSLTYQEQTINMSNVLFDTGCASTIFDTDLMANIGLYLDIINGTAKRILGIDFMTSVGLKVDFKKMTIEFD
jgi:hypothetical protein